MLKILIVDDEPYQVKALAVIIKKMKPDYEIFEAFDGKEALEFIKLNAVDVVITDIRMPAMSGLEMIEKVSQLGSKPEIIISSGYGEFQYAQKAINFGVFEYLVKPISKGDIENILKRIEDKFHKKSTELQQKNNMIRKLESTLPVYIEHQLNRWVENDLDQYETEEISEIFPYKGYGALLATRISRYKKMADIYSPEEVKNLLQHFKFMMKEVLYPIGHSISFFSEKSPDIMITILASQRDFNLMSDKNERAIKAFINKIKDEFGLTVTVGISDKSANILKDLAPCFEQGAEALEYSFIMGSGEIIHFSNIRSKAEKGRLDIYSFEEELVGIVKKPVNDMTAKNINDIFDKHISGLHYIKPQKLKEYLHYIAINMAKSVRNVLVDEHYDILIESLRNSIFDSDSYRELKYAFIDIIEKLAGYMNTKENSNNYMVVQKCKKYIDENFAEDISLETMAGKYHFSPSYFSNIFKSYAGTGFSEYLMSVRLQKSQYLLKNTDYKIYVISEKVGYKDSAYFNRIFKREVGISPYKFRQISTGY